MTDSLSIKVSSPDGKQLARASTTLRVIPADAGVGREIRLLIIGDIQHRLVQRQLQRFADERRARTFIVPTQLNLDPTDGYPDSNGVHPNATGYKQVGASIYAWLKWRLAKGASPPVLQ